MQSNSEKKTLIDIFNNIKNPNLEEAYIRFPNGILKPVSKKRYSSKVESSESLIKKLQKKYGNEYMQIHTHPSGNPFPSPNDILSFLGCKNCKTEIIIPLNEEHIPQGYFALKKNTNYNSSITDNTSLLADTIWTYEQGIKSGNPKELINGLRKSAKKLGFSYRFFPAKGVSLSPEWQGLKKNKTVLEELLPISLIILPLLLIFNFSNINGNTILNYLNIPLNRIGFNFFFMSASIIGILFYLKTSLFFSRK